MEGLVNYFFVFGLTIGLYGTISWALVLKILPDLGEWERVILGYFLSIPITTLFLYYMLMLFPRQSDFFYFGGISLIWLVLGALVWESLIINIRRFFYSFRKKIIFNTLFILVGTVLFSILSLYVIKRPLTEHDTFEYAIQGKVFYLEKYIGYSSHRFNESNGFYFVGLHGFSFPLIITWENISNFGTTFSNYFLKLMSGWYSLGILTLSLIVLRKINKNIAIIGVILLGMTYGFVMSAIKFHIDSYRIFLMMTSVFLMMKYLKTKKLNYFWVSSAICGLFAFVHSTGVFISGSLFLAAFLFDDSRIFERIKKYLSAVGLFLLFGGIHYVLDVFWGTGWIFKDFRFY